MSQIQNYSHNLFLMIKSGPELNRLREFKQENTPRSSRISYETRNQEPKFIRKPQARARELITQNSNRPVVHFDGGSCNQQNIQIKFYSPKSILKYKSQTGSFKGFKFNSPQPRTSDLMGSFRSPKSHKGKVRDDGRDSDNMSSEGKVSSFNMMEQHKEKSVLESESLQLKTLVERLEIEVKRLKQELLIKESIIQGNRQALKRSEHIYREKLEELSKSEILVARLETELMSIDKDDKLVVKTSKGNIKTFDFQRKIQELDIENLKLTEKLNRKIEQFKYQDIELGTLRRKKNQLVNLQIKSLRLTEKNRQLEAKVERFKSQLAKARSPKKMVERKLRKESNDSIFSLSPDHSLDQEEPNNNRNRYQSSKKLVIGGIGKNSLFFQ